MASRRHFLRQIVASIALASFPLQRLIESPIAREVRRFSEGRIRYVVSKTGFDPVGFHGGNSLGWLEDASGPFAWVDRAQRIHWPGGEITRVFQR